MTKRKEAPVTDFKALLLKPCLRIDEVAILLDVTPRTVRKYLEERKLTPVPDPGGRLRVRTEEVRKY